MNLQSVFEELDKLYEFVEEPAEEQPEAMDNLTEAADEEIEIVEDEEEAFVEEESVVEEDEVKLVLECANCGAVMIKVEADIKIDEETALANVEEACQYCEAADGHKILGIVAPYDVDDVEESAEEAKEEEVIEDEAPAED